VYAIGRQAVLVVVAVFVVFGPVGLALERPAAAAGGTTVYLPNITKMLGGDDGWQTPFIVQNVGSSPTDVGLDFYSFSGQYVKTRNVPGLAPGTSFFHSPNHDPDLAPGGQFSVVIRSASSPVVVVVNEHQNQTDPSRQEALSYAGISRGSTKVFLPYTAYAVRGWLTTMIIQNLGAAVATVSAKFVSFDGTKTATLTRTIAVGRSQFIDPRIEPTLTPGVEYAVSMTADQPIGVVVNAHNDAPGVPAPMGFSYNGILPIEDTDTFIPYAVKNADGIGRSTRLVLQNMGLTPATPTVYYRRLGDSSGSALGLEGTTAVAPGAAWVEDLLLQSPLPNGEYGVHITGGQFAVVSATTSPTTAMGFANYSGNSNLFYLPNITRTLGGPAGWTTPIIIQSVSTLVRTARLSWYRFADGALITTQTLTGLTYGASVRVDPRLVPGLSDDTQYAVVVETPSGGVAVVVTELNFGGGDGAMVYEGFEPPAPAAFGVNSCTPNVAPSGSVFICRFYGLPAGVTPVTVSRSFATGSPTTSTFDDRVAIDGYWVLYVRGQTVGLQTLTASAGGVGATASFTVGLANFAVAITQSRNGALTAQTKPGLSCVAEVRLSDGSFSNAPGLQTMQVADAAGNVSWIYTPIVSPAGSATHTVYCTQGHETIIANTTFSVP
jgi:hypothetical protein